MSPLGLRIMNWLMLAHAMVVPACVYGTHSPAPTLSLYRAPSSEPGRGPWPIEARIPVDGAVDGLQYLS